MISGTLGKTTGEKVVVVGSGISGLLTVLMLHRLGYRPTLVTRAPDPRGRRHRRTDGATDSGLQTRFVTLYEGHPYLGDSPMYPGMAAAFTKPVSAGGWLGKPLIDYSREEREWLERRAVANANPDQIAESFTFYRDANRLALNEWRRLRRVYPRLFSNVADEIVRCYKGECLFAWAEEQHRKDGVLLASFAAPEVADCFPHLAAASNAGTIDGALLVEGFSFDIQHFCRTMVSIFETMGIPMYFAREVSELIKDGEDRVAGLLARSGRPLSTSSGDRVISADHYCLCLGAYDTAGALLDTKASKLIGGVVGRWAVLPKPRSMEHSIKLHGSPYRVGDASRPVIDHNLAVFRDSSGRDWIVVGGGYAYVGKNPYGLSVRERQVIDDENERNLRVFLTEAYLESQRTGQFFTSSRECVRSFSHDDLPVQECYPTNRGGVLIIVGGTNTGTTTLAPVEAQMVASRILANGGTSVAQGCNVGHLVSRLDQLTLASRSVTCA